MASRTRKFKRRRRNRPPRKSSKPLTRIPPSPAGDRCKLLAELFRQGSFPKGRGSRVVDVPRVRVGLYLPAGVMDATEAVAREEGTTVRTIVTSMLLRWLVGRKVSEDILPEAAIVEALAGDNYLTPEQYVRYAAGDKSAVTREKMGKLLR